MRNVAARTRPDPALIARLRRDLRAAADPAKAGPMRAYMKSEMPFLGVQTPLRRKLTLAAFRDRPLASSESWQQTIRLFWEGAEFREERYAAVELATWKPYAPFRTPAALPLLEHLIRTGAWWDYVDALAIHGVGDILVRHRPPVTKRLRSWMKDDCLWIRRTAIICQVGRKEQTDLDLLYAAIRANWADRDFFIRKAIGWALRDYAWHDPAEVTRFVAAHAEQLSPLSRREALKNLGMRPVAAAGRPGRSSGPGRCGRAGTASVDPTPPAPASSRRGRGR